MWLPPLYGFIINIKYMNKYCKNHTKRRKLKTGDLVTLCKKCKMPLLASNNDLITGVYNKKDHGIYEGKFEIDATPEMILSLPNNIIYIQTL